MPKQQDRMPPTGAGLIRYFQEEGSGVKISPKSVVGVAIGIIVFEILLRVLNIPL